MCGAGSMQHAGYEDGVSGAPAARCWRLSAGLLCCLPAYLDGERSMHDQAVPDDDDEDRARNVTV